MRDLEEYSKAYQICKYEHFHAKCRQRILADVLRKYQPRSLMEVGCGLKPLFSEYDSAEINYIIEPSEEFISLAKKSFPPSSQLKYINKLFEDVSFNDVENIFDCIVISGLLNEVKLPGQILESARRFGNDNTIYIFTVPNANSLHRHIGLASGAISSVFEMSSQQKIFQQHHIFDENTFSKLINKSGFKIISMDSILLKPFTHQQMQSILDQTNIDHSILEAMYCQSSLAPDLGSELLVEAKIKSPE